MDFLVVIGGMPLADGLAWLQADILTCHEIGIQVFAPWLWMLQSGTERRPTCLPSAFAGIALADRFFVLTWSGASLRHA
jgi:hypothetical protein